MEQCHSSLHSRYRYKNLSTQEFDSVITLTSFLSEPLPLQRLVNVLLEYESQSACVVQDVPLCANLLEATPSQVGSVRGGRFSSGDRGRGFRTRL